ncbi:MFS transporter [Candidatus Shapirobacteria bacterium]|nr:MFS transporter [Candidatus Shapirobacteria bacterium]
MKNPKLRLFFISQSLAFTYFWLVLAIPYLIYRGLSPTEAFTLMSIYQLFGVLLEYPTGVIGDKFGYRKVTYLANTLNFLSMLIMCLPGNYYQYLFALLILALGNGFSSGNDMGILKSISLDIKKDTANYNSLMDFVLFITSIIGGYVSRISYELALVVSGVCMFSANIPLYLLRNDINETKNNNSFISIIQDGFSYLNKHKFKLIFIIIAIFGGYSFTIKSIFGNFGQIYNVAVVNIGFLIGVGGLARSIGSKLYAEKPKVSLIYVTTAIAGSLIAMSIFPKYIVVVCLMTINQVFFGYLLSKIDGDIHELSEDHIRASLFSLKRLSMR